MGALMLSAASVAVAVLCWLPPRRSPASTRAVGCGPPGLVATARRPRLSRLRWRARRSSPADRLLQVLDMVAAQVRAGAAPVDAWLAALDLVGASATLIADPPADLLRWAGRDAAAGHTARAAAAAWRLAERTGAPLGGLLDSLCATVRAERADRAAVEAALAGPRATSRLLLALPAAGIGLGELIGAAPVHVLMATSAGRACAVGGGALLLVGHLWMRRLVAAVEALGDPMRGAAVAAAVPS